MRKLSLASNTWKYLISALIGLMSIFVPLSAAIADYSFSSSLGTYQEITGGSVYSASTVVNDDHNFNTIELGFDFIFNESTYSNVNINTNGVLFFGNNTSATTVMSTAISTSTVTNLIAGLNRDLQATTDSELMSLTSGVSPNKVFIVQWKNYKRYSTNGVGDSFNFQIKLYETSNKIEFVYGNMIIGSVQTATSCTYQIGLKGMSNIQFKNRSVIDGSDTWQNSSEGTTNTANCTMNSNLMPQSGLTYSWISSGATTVPNPAIVVSPLDNANNIDLNPTLSWISGGGMPSGYKFFLGTDNPPTNLVNNQDLENVNLFTITTILNFSTNYNWKVVPYNNFGQAQDCPVWSFTTRENDILTPPCLQDFSATTFPPTNWTRLSGQLNETTTLTATTSGWVRTENFANNTVNNTSGSGSKMNIYGSNRYYWLVTPSINLGIGSPNQLEFDLALTDFGNSSPIENTNGIDDKFSVVISTDNGSSWSSANILRLWDNDVATNSESYNDISHSGQRVVINLSAYSGLVKIAFYGESLTANVDNDLHIDNVKVVPVPTTPVFAIQPLEKNFGQVNINAISATQIFTITNEGSSALIINNASINGVNANEFSLVINNSLPISLASNQSTTLSVSFNPSTVGEKTANLQVIDNLSRNIHNIPLSGSAYDASIINFPYTQNFDNVIIPALPLGWSKINTGSASANIESFTSTTAGVVYSAPNTIKLYNASDVTGFFALVTPPVLDMNTKRVKFFARSGSEDNHIKVGYLADSTNPSSYVEISNINLTTSYQEFTVSLGNAPTGNHKIVFKHGVSSTYQTLYLDDLLIENLPTAVEFYTNTESINYRNVNVGRPSIYTATITNNGQGILNVNATLPTGISLDQNTPIQITAGQSINVDFSLIAQASQLGSYNQNIILTTNDINHPSVTIPVTANVLPQLPEGMFEIGNGIVVNQNLPYEPFYRYSYSQTIYPASSLSLNENNRITQLAYSFNGNSAFSDSIKIYMGSSNLNTFSTTSSWIPLNNLQLVFNGIVNTEAQESWVTINLDNFFDYTPGTNLVVALLDNQGGNYHTNNDEFYCTQISENRSLEYHNDTNVPDPANPPVGNLKNYYPNTRLLFSPVASSPLFLISPSFKDFGMLQVNTQSPSQIFSIRNIGIGTLNINNIQLSGTNANQFQVINSNTMPISVQSMQTASIEVKFTPTSIGTKQAVLQLTDNLSRVVRTVVLMGTCFDATITSFPYTENFDSLIIPNLPLGWQKIVNSTATSSAVDSYSSTSLGVAYSTPNNARLTNSNDLNSELLLISPVIQNANGKRLKFYARGSSTDYALSVGYITNPYDANTYVELGTYVLTAIHQEYMLSLASMPAGNGQIAFKHLNGGTYRTIYIDDVLLQNLPTTSEFAINVTSLNMGQVYAYNSKTLAVEITNNGTQNLTINWNMSNLFTINPSGITTISANNSSIINITFSPTVSQIGAFTENILLNTNDPLLPVFTLPISGTVLAPLPSGLYEIGDGNDVNESLPFDPYYCYSYSQTIYLADELPVLTGMAINQIGYHYNGGTAFSDSVKIYMGYTDLDEFPLPATFNAIDSLELVYDGLLTTISEDGWVTLDLNPTFEFVNGRNLIVAFIEAQGGSYHTTNDDFFTTNTNLNRSLSFRSDTIVPSVLTPPTTVTRKTHIPNTRFFIGTNYPRPNNLTRIAGNAMVSLSWTAPNLSREEQTSRIMKARGSSSVKANKEITANNTDRMLLTGYKVYRNNQEIALIPENTLFFTDTDVSNEVTYSYYVTAVYSDPIGESFPSNTVTATPQGSILNPPVRLTASLSGNNVQLNWINGELKLNENFNTSDLPDNWSLMDIDGDNNNWASSSVNPHSGQRCLESISTGLNPNNWLITPQIVLGNNPVLSWWVGGSSGEQLGDQYRIFVSTASATEFTNQVYQEILITGDWTRKSLDLSAYANQSIYLAFVHRNSANKLSVKFDDIAISSSIVSAKSETKNINERNHQGYKIYRDNVQISQVSPTTLSYIDTNPVGSSHTYFVTSIYDEGESIASNFVNITDQDEIFIPTITQLKGNYPNPFNPETIIAFDLSEDQHTSIEIYNVKGQKVKTLLNEFRKAGTHKVTWNGKNDHSQNCGSGIYFYRMKTGKYTSTGKMILMK